MLIPSGKPIVIEMFEAKEADMRPRKTNSMFVGIVLLAALTALPAFDGWSMGSRVPAVGMQAEDFRLTDLAGKEQSLSQ